MPQHYKSEHAARFLDAYILDYISEEIQAEALVRNVPAFAKFLTSLAHTHGELTNFSAIANDCGVDAKTAKEFYQILVDTMIGIELSPFSRRGSREVIKRASKYYLFDVGVAAHLR